MANAGVPVQRFYDLDVLRAMTMFLGIVLHTGVFVLPEALPVWPIHDAAATGDPTYKLVIEALHAFRMPVFFLLSGFFCTLLWQRQDLRAMAVHRLRRIGIPFIAGCFTIIPLCVWLLAHAAGYKAPYDFPLWALPLIWLFGTLAHLWFLWHLLLMAGGLVLAARLGMQFRHPTAWWLVIPISMVISLVMVQPIYGGDVAGSLFSKESAVILYNACFFILGVFFYQRGISARPWWTVALLPAVVAFVAGFYLLEQYIATYEGVIPSGDAAATQLGAVPNAFMFRHPLTLASTLIETVCAWLMCFGLMGLFNWIASRESFTTRYLADASYWMYIAHLPLVIAGQMLVVGWPIHYHLKYLVVCLGVTLVLLVTYQFGVRYTFIGRALNGPRSRRPRASRPSAAQSLP